MQALLNNFLTSVRHILGDAFTGLYLGGSLASGDFNVESSDIDFTVVTTHEVSTGMLRALQSLHMRLATESKWGAKLEGAYVPLAAFRRYDPAHSHYPNVSVGGHCAIEGHGSNEAIQLWTIREHGIALAGPDPRTLIDPVQPDELRQAVRGILREWWAPQLQDPFRLARREYQAYATLTMCRMRYTLAHGAIVSKPRAAQWAQAELDARWKLLIERALAWPHDDISDEADYEETLKFIRETLEKI